MGNALSPVGDIETISGALVGGGGISGDGSFDPLGTQSAIGVADQTESDIFQFFSDTRRDVSEYLLTSGRQSGQLAEDIVGVAQDFQRGGLTTVNNVTGNMMYSGRFVAANVVALLDNQLDNVHDVLDSARTDLSSTIQMFALVTGAGIAVMFILYGDQIMRKGISLGEISLF